MVTFVPISDPQIAEEMRLAGLLYCGFNSGDGPSKARKHWELRAIE